VLATLEDLDELALNALWRRKGWGVEPKKRSGEAVSRLFEMEGVISAGG